MVRDSFNKHPIINTVSRAFSLITLAVSVFFVIIASSSNILPAKFFYPILIIIALFNLAFLHIAFRARTTKRALIVLNIISVLLSSALIFSNFKLTEISGFINENFEPTKKYSVYNVIVNKESKASSMKDLVGGEIFTYEEPVKEVSNRALEDAIKNTIADSSLVFKDDLDIVMNRAAKLTEVASVVNNGTYESYISINEDYTDKIKIIGEIKIEITGKIEEETAKKPTLANTPFIAFINGIDTRTNTMPTRSLSDVNILAAVNPNTKKILLVAIPRDAYIHLSGTGDLYDKLTHSGARGGVELTISTIEELFDLKIDRYIRVNFNFVENLVNKIGGISIDNDQNRTLNLDGCILKPGENEVNGKCALRFSRERKSYSTGDRHRGENQEQVIKRIFEKISRDKNLISDSTAILDSLSGSFDTSFTTYDIKNLVRMQLDDMSSWNIETYNIDGKTTNAKTLSYPNKDLSVLLPDYSTINTAKIKINEVLN